MPRTRVRATQLHAGTFAAARLHQCAVPPFVARCMPCALPLPMSLASHLSWCA